MPTLDAQLTAFGETFWKSVDKSAGENACWPWTGRKDSDGYGLLKYNGTTRASRMALVLTIGPLKPGRIARHTCDNPPCCNPAHLLPGTHRQNAADRDRRGRNGKAKLTAVIVLQMRELYGENVREKELAGRFGVPLTTTYNIVRNRTWKWVNRRTVKP